MTRLLLIPPILFVVVSALAAAFGVDPGPMPCGVEDCG